MVDTHYIRFIKQFIIQIPPSPPDMNPTILPLSWDLFAPIFSIIPILKSLFTLRKFADKINLYNFRQINIDIK